MKKISLLLFCCLMSYASFALSTLGNAGGTTPAGNVCAPATNQIIYQFSIAQTFSTRTLTTVNFTTAGTYVAADITQFTLWRNTVNTFGTATAIGTPLVAGLGAGAHAYNAGGDALNVGVTYYYWITANLPGTAIAGQTISVSTVTVVVSGGGTAGAVAAGTTQTIDVSPNGVTANAAPNPLCVGDNLTLTGTATGATTYLWTGPAGSGYSSAVLNPPAYSVAATDGGVFTLTATSAGGCSTTATTASVVVNAGPTGVTATATPNPVCEGSNLTLTGTATGATTYSWTGPAGSGYTSAVLNPPAFASALLDAGIFTLTATSAGGCTTTATTAAVVVNPIPTAITATAAPTTLCVGANLTLTGTATGATTYSWTGPAGSGYTSAVQNPPAFAVTALDAGIYTLTTTSAAGCNATATTAAVVVNAAPTGVTASAAPNPVCAGSNLTLTGTATGATTYLWTGPAGSGYTSALLNPAAFSAVAADAGIFTLTATNAGGCSATATTATVVVNSLPTGLTASAAPNPVCSGANLTLTGTAVGGSAPTYTWTGPGIGSLAGLVPGAFAVTAANAGIYTLTATVAGCVNVTATTAAVVVNAAPTGVTASAAPNPLCVGDNLTLTGTATGAIAYSWAGPAGSGYSSGVLNPPAFATSATDAGIYTLTATTAGGCTTTATTSAVVVNGLPSPITGVTGICVGSTSPLSDATGGGAWSSSNIPVATVNAVSGLVSGVSVGNATITYTVGSCYSTAIVTVSLTPSSGIISGPSNVCVGAIGNLIDAAPGGTWSVSNGNASISATGVLTGLAIGIDTITYLVSNACGLALTNFTDTISAAPNSGFIVGPTFICVGSFALLTDTAAGGVWSCTNATGTISATGMFTAVTSGIDTINYTSTTQCGNMVSSKVISINPLPDTGIISGASSVCVGATINMTETSAGGVWSSVNGNATISATGVVTGMISGTDTIKYTVTNSCGTLSTSKVITINPIGVNAITGPNNVCVGSAITLTDATPAGTFSSGNLDATITSSGVMTGALAGLDTITYTVVSICGTYSTTKVVTIQPLPNAGVISGPGSVCIGATITLTDSISAGGVWTSASNAIATVDSISGVVTGISAATVNINYLLTSAYGCITEISKSIVVNPNPVVLAITGVTNECVGGTTLLSDATVGGAWISSDSTKAQVGATTGIINGLIGGVVTISYSITNDFGCTTTRTTADTINAIPYHSPITGNTQVCIGSISTLSDSVLYGTWSSLDTTYAIVSAGTGVVTGVSAGTTTIVYSVTNSCGSITDSAIVTIKPLPSVSLITGYTGNICSGTSFNLADSTIGGVWSSSNNSLATITGTGLVTGVATGTDTILYTVTNSVGCIASATQIIVLGGAISATVLPSGSTTLCHGTSVYMHVATADTGLTFQWFLNGVLISGATNYFYNATSAGSYSILIRNSTCEENLTGPVVSAPPSATITFVAPNLLYTGSFLTYQWFRNGIAISGANTSVYMATSNGYYAVVVTDGGGCSDTSAAYLVNDIISGIKQISATNNISYYPNPVSSELHIDTKEAVNVRVMSPDGKFVIRENGVFGINVTALPAGLYIIMIYDQDDVLITTSKFTKI